jgi:hypothetical protein
MQMFDKAVDWAKKRYPKEHRYMMRLWRASWKISPIISIGAVLILSAPAAIIGFTIGKMFGTTNIYNNIPAPGPTPSNNDRTVADRWEPLSAEETLELRKEWRALPAEHLAVLCAIPACADLAESIYDLAKGLDWPAAYQASYMTDDTGIHTGIEIWSYAPSASARDKIADAIEHATNGRLKISSHEYTWQDNAAIPLPANLANSVNIIIGRRR